MKKITTLTLAVTLATAALSVRAQVTLDGTITTAEIGTTAGKYQSLGKFTTSHIPVTGGPTGFGNAGLLQLYGANSATKLYIGIAGTIETGGNNFQLYMDLPNKTGVPVGTGLPSIAGASTVFGTFSGGSIGGTKLDLEADAAIATTGQGDVQAAIYKSATSAVAKSLGGGAAILLDGTPNPVYDATGDYALFANTRVAYKQSATGLSGNPGNANGGGAGSYALEYEFDRTALGLPSGASIVKVFVAYVSGDAYWSSDFIPETVGNGKDSGGLYNIGFSPDFTDQTRFPGTQAASVNVLVLSSRQADEAVVAMSVFPNPAESRATVAYQVQGAAQDVSVRVLDLLGREVRTLLSAKQTPGFHDLGVPTDNLAAGAYLVRVQVGDKVATRQLAVTR
ncbi:T9SS type A sorting domain-containing protein [Hymenobacter sp. RP-2-7]|uniref:T9SS type A sorting domain-containing protein n=1 Tax=Hymenobacter polaris TaxID=2682546 RepID=A0A7Y0ADS6_9BACT|nr:T9SS type A sorting domain-containing protein [Hymenobacter polaris]NML65485.1 T9SS type A sorting domain-containing protein [Hymenobacter polaris]